MIVGVPSQSGLRILYDRISHTLLESRFRTHRRKLSRLLTQLLTFDDAVFKIQARGSAICQNPLPQTPDSKATRMSVLIGPAPASHLANNTCAIFHDLLPVALSNCQEQTHSSLSLQRALEAVLGHSALPPRRDVSPACRALLIGARSLHVDVGALRKSARSAVLPPMGAAYRNLGGQVEDNYRGPHLREYFVLAEIVYNTTGVY